MPGEESLRKQQYYAHPRNQFWDIIRELFALEPTLDYAERVQWLMDNGIALWDVIEHCQREGSLDTSIVTETIVVNDFQTLLSRYDSITHLYFNGRKAEMEFMRRVLPGLSIARKLHYRLLPSSSPAHASISRAEKLKRWSQIKLV